LNLRPPGPQPGALPDCATPRDASILRPLPASAVRLLCEHMFVPGKPTNTPLRTLLAVEAASRVCLASEGKGPARQLLSPVSGCIQTRALCGPPRALHRQCVATKARADRRAHGLPHRVLPRAAVRRLRRDRPSGPRVRPHRAQELQHLRGHPRPQMAVGTRRDRAVRGGLRELPSSPNSTPSGVCPCLSPKPGLRATDANKRATGIEPALKAWKAFVQPKHFARTPSLNPTAAPPELSAPPPVHPQPHRPAPAAAKAQTNCPEPHQASRWTR
jgi:hypothetical protein